MDDAKWLFQKDSREKKSIANSARKKVRHTGCKLPSDYLTQAQKKKMNGEVLTMNMNAPVAYKAFKLFPIDIQKEYLNGLVKKYHVTGKQVAEMMGITAQSLHKYMQQNHISTPFSRNGKCAGFDPEKWDKFLRGIVLEVEATEQNAPESLENGLEETKQEAESGSALYQEMVENAKKRVEKLEAQVEQLSIDPADIEMGAFVPAAKCDMDCNRNAETSQQKETINHLRHQNRMLRSAMNTFYGRATIDEVVTEQPYSIGDMGFTLHNVRDWPSVLDLVSRFPLPANNEVRIIINNMEEKPWAIR